MHTFSLVHDDLPALDDDDERRGRPSAHVAHGEGVALLAGDALLTEALRLALSYERREPARELAEATLGMIGGQYLDVDARRRRAGGHAPTEDGTALRRGGRARALGRGRPRERTGAWRAFGEELGLLFQAVDDVIDGDGYALELGEDGARGRRSGGRQARARAARRARRRHDGAREDRRRPRRQGGLALRS